jgi:hypothetical protein
MKTAKEGKMKTKVMIVSGIFTMVFVFVLGFSPVNAAIPYTINYQGYLTDAMGSPVNGTVSMTFSLYTVASGGTVLWTEPQNVIVSGGIYSVILGSVSTLTPLAFDVPYWLGVKVGSDAEMTPRVQLTSVGYSFTSDMAMDLVCPGCVNFSDIGQNGCTANQFMMWSGTAWTCSIPAGIAETDPQVNTLVAGGWCVSDGAVINCNATPGAETDPQVGATTLNQWCIGSGPTVECSQSAAALAAAHNHDAAYVNVTGDAMTGALTVGINGAGSALSSTNSGTGPGLTVTGGGDGSYADILGDLFLGGDIGEIFAIGANDSDLNLYSNGFVFIDLDDNNDAPNAQFRIYNGTNNYVFTVDESGNVTANGVVSGALQNVNGGAPIACDASTRGRFWFTNNGAAKDDVLVCVWTGAAYLWHSIY